MENQPATAPEGAAAEADPLAFTPVPRRNNRADGLNADIQRNFIRILACCGSPRRAAKAVGKAAYGFVQLREADGADGFNRAWDAAIALFKAQETRRVAINADIVQQENNAWEPALGPFANAASRAHLRPPPEPTAAELEQQDKSTWSALMGLCEKYILKLEAERRCRREGRIAEADFYVRQITFLECSLDSISGDGMTLLRDYRAHGYDLREIAETPMSQILGELRRAHFTECGDPARPEHPPRHLLKEVGDFKVEPVHPPRAPGVSHAQHRTDQDAQYAKDAAAQIEWETRARAEWAEWHARQPNVFASLADPETASEPLSRAREREVPKPQAWEGEGLTDDADENS